MFSLFLALSISKADILPDMPKTENKIEAQQDLRLFLTWLLRLKEIVIVMPDDINYRALQEQGYKISEHLSFWSVCEEKIKSEYQLPIPSIQYVEIRAQFLLKLARLDVVSMSQYSHLIADIDRMIDYTEQEITRSKAIHQMIENVVYRELCRSYGNDFFDYLIEIGGVSISQLNDDLAFVMKRGSIDFTIFNGEKRLYFLLISHFALVYKANVLHAEIEYNGYPFYCADCDKWVLKASKIRKMLRSEYHIDSNLNAILEHNECLNLNAIDKSLLESSPNTDLTKYKDFGMFIRYIPQEIHFIN